MMKFLEIFRFEFKYQLSQRATWIYFFALLLFSFWLSRAGNPTDTKLYINAPSFLIFVTIFGNVIWLLMSGAIAGHAASRDVQMQMYPLLYTTPIRKIEYFGGRFTAAALLNSLLQLMVPLGFFLGFTLIAADPSRLTPFRAEAFLTTYFYVSFPVALIVTALQFSASILGKNAITSYIVSILLFPVTSLFVGTMVANLFDNWELYKLIDLIGVSIISTLESWTPVESNTRLISLEGTFLLNRLMWTVLACGILAITYNYFRFSHINDIRRWGFFKRRKKTSEINRKQSEDIHTSIQYGSITVGHNRGQFNTSTFYYQSLAIARESLRIVLKSRFGLIIFAIMAIGTGLFATEYMQWFDVPLAARAEEILRILAPPLNSYKTHWIIIPLLIIFYAGELVWHEREAKINELKDASPVPEASLFLGKFFGLSCAIAIWMGFLMLAGLINKLIMGSSQLELDVFFVALFGLQFINYILFALFILTIQVLVNQKYIGYLMALAFYAIILFPSIIGIDHKMLIYTSDLGWSYTDMQGFDPYLQPWLWFKFYWTSWAILIASTAILFWVRSKDNKPISRLNIAKRRFGTHKIAFFIALPLLLASGGFIFYNTNILNDYVSPDHRKKMLALYELRYGKYKNAAQPVISKTALHIEIYPEDQLADIKGNYKLVNNSDSIIDSIHLSSFLDEAISGISFDREVASVIQDNEVGFHSYKLLAPLQPGDSVNMSFLLNINSANFDNTGVGLSVVENGSHLTSNWMPQIGYNSDKRLYSENDRKEYGLPTRLSRPSLNDTATINDNRHAQRMDFQATISTSNDQIAVAPGTLQRTWAEGGRNYFHYKTNTPIHNVYAIFSARYAVKEDVWSPSLIEKDSSLIKNSVSIQIYYHPEHGKGIDRMMQSIKASLSYYSKEFGPYQYANFRVLERPGAGRGMHAEPMTIDYQSGYSLMEPSPDGLDLPYHIMAHEVAHQWWGYYLSPAAVEGSGFLVESFATYSAMQVVEETLGHDHLKKYLDQMRQEYENPISRAMPPLLQANNAFMNYRKGPFALLALEKYIGQGKVNKAMRELLKKYSPEPPLPTTLDFYRELQAVTPDSLHYLVHDLFAENTFWELETTKATAKQTEEGEWQVTLEVEARKLIVDLDGVEKDVSMNDWIEVGVYTTSEKEKSGMLYLEKHRLQSGKQTIVINVPDQPATAGIDPNYLMIDFKMDDNVKKIEIDGMEAKKDDFDLI